MLQNQVLKIMFFLLALSPDWNHSQAFNESLLFSLTDAEVRFARRKCLRQFPQAEIASHADTLQTRCFLHCFVLRVGLIDLGTRGLDNVKLLDIWEKMESFKEDNCLERFDFAEPLSGTCNDTYRKLMELRNNCLELFEYIFDPNSIGRPEDYKNLKKIGQSATEFCDSIEKEDTLAKEISLDDDVSLLSLYKNKLKCVFKNIYYLDAYGRVDEREIILSFQEAQVDSSKAQAIVRTCSHRANSKYQQDYLGDTVLELQNCLKAKSSVYHKVFKLRDETSRMY